MTTQPPGRVLISVKEVVTKLNISRTTLHRLRTSKTEHFPKAIKEGKARSAPAHFVLEEIEAYIQRKMDDRHAA
jgi:predicted DNA-binding transcriptional regulator AlpA